MNLYPKQVSAQWKEKRTKNNNNKKPLRFVNFCLNSAFLTHTRPYHVHEAYPHSLYYNFITIIKRLIQPSSDTRWWRFPYSLPVIWAVHRCSLCVYTHSTDCGCGTGPRTNKFPHWYIASALFSLSIFSSHWVTDSLFKFDRVYSNCKLNDSWP